MSRGECFTGRMMAEYLGFPFVDTADVITFRADSSIDMEKTSRKAQGCDWRRKVLRASWLLWRDGRWQNQKAARPRRRDITGAIVAQCLGADLYENWTDVSGFPYSRPTHRR